VRIKHLLVTAHCDPEAHTISENCEAQEKSYQRSSSAEGIELVNFHLLKRRKKWIHFRELYPVYIIL
jgi:hypothetical protein